MKTRRNFLRQCCNIATAGAGIHVAKLGLVSAQAQSTGGYKALVCVFMFGGNDANNMIVPYDDNRYGLYSTMRGPVALTRDTLLPVNAGSLAYGLHPRLTNLQSLYGQGRMAMVFNVGTLVRPTTKATLQNSPLPRNLYSHSDQTQQWQTSDPNGGATGWGGRINDLLVAQNTGTLPPGVSLNGGNVMLLNGQATKGLNFTNSGTFGLSTFGDGNAMTARLAGLEKVLTFDTGLQMVGSANGVLADAIKSAKEINAALQSAPALPVTFPNSGLGSQLAQVARIISVRGALGMNRQIFFAGIGGFDTHEQLVARQDGLMAALDGAIGAFQTTVQTMGVANNVTLFTESEFNRTGNSNANVGSDHGWGSHHFVVGGAVHGGQAYGTFPSHVLQGPDDAGDRGNFIPSTSLDQYAATLATWFGVPSGNLAATFPNLANFSPQSLGFV
jgi:uncharacterized protein (DUF1501 family)